MSVSETYEHPCYELEGRWNNKTGDMRLWFPVSPNNPGSLDTPFVSRRMGLLRELVSFTLSPEVYRFDDTSDVQPLATSSEDIPQEEMDGRLFDVEIVLVKARFLSQRGDNALAVTADFIEDYFGDEMLERVQG